MSDNSNNEDILALLGTVTGLQAFCSALAGALPPSLAAIVAGNLTITIQAFQKKLATDPETRTVVEHAVQALLTVQTALNGAVEAGAPEQGKAQH